MKISFVKSAINMGPVYILLLKAVAKRSHFGNAHSTSIDEIIFHKQVSLLPVTD